MDSVTLVMISGIIVWVCIGLCLFQLGSKQRKLTKRLEQLEKVGE